MRCRRDTGDGLARILKRLESDGWLIRFKKDYCLWPSGLDQTRQLITFVWPNFRRARADRPIQLNMHLAPTPEPEKYPTADRVFDPKYPIGGRVSESPAVGGK